MARRCMSVGHKILRKFSVNKEEMANFEKDPLKLVWKHYITKNGGQAEFFKRAYEIIIAQYPEMRKVFLPFDTKRMETVLEKLSRNLEKFFATLMEDEEYLQDEEKFANHCSMVGMRHTAYSPETFDIYYWDVFVCSMVQVLESMNAPLPQVEAWENLVQKVVKHMKKGYDQGIVAQKKMSMCM